MLGFWFYFIGIVNFSIHENSDQVLYRYRLKERFSNEPMTDRIEFLFLEVPNCKNALTSEATQLDKICYALGHISEMDSQPEDFKGEFFDLLFKSAEIANFAPRERNQYIKDMTTERDRINQYNTAVRKGIEREREEVRDNQTRLIARNMLAMKLSVEKIAQATGLSIDEVQSLRS